VLGCTDPVAVVGEPGGHWARVWTLLGAHGHFWTRKKPEKNFPGGPLRAEHGGQIAGPVLVSTGEKALDRAIRFVARESWRFPFASQRASRQSAE
jgi:hypothetical protein